MSDTQTSPPGGTAAPVPSSAPARRPSSMGRRLRNGAVTELWALAGIGIAILMWELV